MINKNEQFTITLLINDDNDKLILISKGDIPAKDESEADAVLSSVNEDEREAIDRIISSIPVFSEAEPGSEESVTETLDDFENKFGFSFEEVEDLSGVDVDLDSEEEENHDMDITDPMEVMISAKPKPVHEFTDFEEDESEYSNYDPMVSLKNKMSESFDNEMLDEMASVSEVLSKFINSIKSQEAPLGIDNITEIFNSLRIFNPDAKLQILDRLLKTGNVVLYALKSQENDVNRMVIADASKQLPVEYVVVRDPRQFVSKLAGK